MQDSLVLEKKPAELDYKLVFDHMPGMCLVLDASFKIIAQNADHAYGSHSLDKKVVGRDVFDVFPDNPDDLKANGVSALRKSLQTVLKTREPDVMPIIRYDIQPSDGEYQIKYWAITNSPIMGSDGFVQWIINRADDVTELVELRMRQVH